MRNTGERRKNDDHEMRQMRAADQWRHADKASRRIRRTIQGPEHGLVRCLHEGPAEVGR